MASPSLRSSVVELSPTTLVERREPLLGSNSLELYARAATLIDDAVHGRFYGHRLDPGGRALFDLLHSFPYRLVLGLCVVVQLGLAIVEQPSRFHSPNDQNYAFVGDSVAALLELVCLAVFAIDTVVLVKYFTWPVFLRRRWPFAKLCYVVFATANILIAAMNPHVPRLHRLGRPIMLISQFRNVQKIFGNMMRTAPKVASVFLLLVFHLLLHSVFAYLAFGGQSFDSCTGKRSLKLCSTFDEDCTDYFATIQGSINQLFILLTTANFPDVMMPAYDCNRFACLFFVEFLMVGLFFILNLVLAVAYSTFQEKAKRQTLVGVLKSTAAMDKAFELLQSTCKSLEKGINFQAFSAVCRMHRASFTDDQLRVLFGVLDADNNGTIDQREFRNLPGLLEFKFGLRFTGHEREYTLKWGPVLRARQRLRPIAKHWAFDAFFSMLVYSNGLLIVAEFLPWVQRDQAAMNGINQALTVCLLLFVVEVLIKIGGLGMRCYFSQGFNILDFVVVVTAASIYLLVPHHGASLGHRVDFLRLLRLLRTLRTLKGFAIYVRAFAVIVPTFFRYLVASFTVFYFFAILGMMCFAGIIHEGLAVEMPIAYGKNHYWLNNFNTLGTGLVTLFELLVVNNWGITMDGHIAATTGWAFIFFYSFYFSAVILVVNIVTAFLIDDFTVTKVFIQHERVQEKRFRRSRRMLGRYVHQAAEAEQLHDPCKLCRRCRIRALARTEEEIKRDRLVDESERQGEPRDWREDILQEARKLGLNTTFWTLNRPHNTRYVQAVMFSDNIAQLKHTIDSADDRTLRAARDKTPASPRSSHHHSRRST